MRPPHLLRRAPPTGHCNGLWAPGLHDGHSHAAASDDAANSLSAADGQFDGQLACKVTFGSRSRYLDLLHAPLLTGAPPRRNRRHLRHLLFVGPRHMHLLFVGPRHMHLLFVGPRHMHLLFGISVSAPPHHATPRRPSSPLLLVAAPLLAALMYLRVIAHLHRPLRALERTL